MSDLDVGSNTVALLLDVTTGLSNMGPALCHPLCTLVSGLIPNCDMKYGTTRNTRKPSHNPDAFRRTNLSMPTGAHSGCSCIRNLLVELVWKDTQCSS